MIGEHHSEKVQNNDHAGPFIEYARTQLTSIPKPRLDDEHSDFPNDAAPGYELIHLIHHGGQGIVFRAVQNSTGRQVAIKFLILPFFAGVHNRNRFRREVNALARVDNPHVVGICDSGVTGTYCYLVMDYVDGTSLMEYSGGEELNIKDRLRLFLQICNGVNAAHLRGIIHRDLKPSNILVTPEGESRILDFGLARLVTDNDGNPNEASAVTITGQFVGSLPWASPEQARGDIHEIDIRSDIYSLGVILYQLLTDHFPYEVKGRVRTVTENILAAEPIKPSAYNRPVSGDLDTIVLKCLQKQPERRYQGVAELARDVEYYLDGRPIEARRDSLWYVVRKNVCRHWAAAVVSAIILLLGLSYALTTTVLVRRAWEAAENARGISRRFHETVYAMLGELGKQLERNIGADSVRRPILGVAYAHLLPLIHEVSDDPELLEDQGRTYFLLGDFALILGKFDEGRAHLFNALKTRRRLVLEEHNELRHLDDLSVNLVRIGDSYSDNGELDAAYTYYTEAMCIDEDLVERDPGNTHFRDNLGWSCQRMYKLELRLHGLPQDDALLARAITLFETAVNEEPENALRHYGLCSVQLELAFATARRFGWTKAQALFEEAIKSLERLAALEPNNPLYLSLLANNYATGSDYPCDSGQTQICESWLDRAEDICERVIKIDPGNFWYLMIMARVSGEKAELYEAKHDWNAEHACLRRAVSVTAAAPPEHHPDRHEFLKRRVHALVHLARRGCANGDSNARSLAEEAIQIVEHLATDPMATDDDWARYSFLLRIIVPPELRDTALSVYAAERALVLSGDRAPRYLLPLTDALVADGQLERAREIQQEALSGVSAGNATMRNQILDAVPH